MVLKLFKVLFIYMVVGVFLMISVGSLHAGGGVTVRWGEDSGKKECFQGKSKHKGGPPAHAPAHGYRAKHKYRYYPDCKVYHDAERGLYFYLRGDNWEVGASLPASLKDALGGFVSFELETDQPFLHNADHVKQFSKL